MSGGEKRKHEGGAGDAARRNNKARFYKVAAHSAARAGLSSPPTRVAALRAAAPLGALPCPTAPVASWCQQTRGGSG